MDAIVGIATYNNKNTIAETIRSVEQQFCRPSKLVICDASDDGTKNIIESIANSSELEIVLIPQTEIGIANAYNEILNHISDHYDVFAMIDTNYTVNRNWLETHLQIHSDYSVIGTVCGGRIEGVRLPGDDGYHNSRNISFKKSVLENLQGWEGKMLRGEDWDMEIRLKQKNVLSYTSPSLQLERIGDDESITFSKRLKSPTSIMFLRKYGLFYLKYHPAHVAHDIIALSFVLTALLIPTFYFWNATLGIYTGTLCVMIVLLYLLLHDWVKGSTKTKWSKLIIKLIGTGFAIPISFIRMIRDQRSWNMAGVE